MLAPTLVLLSLLAGHALAQTATITEYVTVPPTTTSNLSAGGPVRQVATDAASSTAKQSTLVTSASSTLSGAGSISTAAQALSTVAPAAPAETSSNATSYDGGSSGSGSGAAVNTDAGASGSGSSFSISKGGLAAIIVVVVIVALFGSGRLNNPLRGSQAPAVEYTGFYPPGVATYYWAPGSSANS
ncbi:hypothetical protein B0A54_17276 [Friedmanniomyces endolithicus]|uniref:Mid2 domain-containing protein n=1 Tax=Friedmanniomyces endolithicus TaxID=329885 RepID=A0A4U0TTD0_9PEZI|nr:hypothetical protein B0A54_17276 [Friedmanniomyces endolithicus]